MSENSPPIFRRLFKRKYGAQAVGLKDTGKLAPGQQADIALISLQNTAFCPKHNLVSRLAYLDPSKARSRNMI